MKDKKYTIEQLSDLSGYSRRTIRYYIQQGLLEPPAGRGRGGFYYDSHVQKLHEIRANQEQGIKLAAMQELSKTDLENSPESIRDIWVRYQIIPGIEIHIKRSVEEREGRRITELIRVVKSIIKGDKNE
ncbi:MAG: MerR family transcriptional regulator [Calditrichaceae bacterium]